MAEDAFKLLTLITETQTARSWDSTRRRSQLLIQWRSALTTQHLTDSRHIYVASTLMLLPLLCKVGDKCLQVRWRGGGKPQVGVIFSQSLTMISAARWYIDWTLSNLTCVCRCPACYLWMSKTVSRKSMELLQPWWKHSREPPTSKARSVRDVMVSASSTGDAVYTYVNRVIEWMDSIGIDDMNHIIT